MITDKEIDETVAKMKAVCNPRAAAEFAGFAEIVKCIGAVADDVAFGRFCADLDASHRLTREERQFLRLHELMHCLLQWEANRKKRNKED